MQHQTAYVNSESISLSSGLCFSFGGCYLYSYLHLHDPNVMQVSDHLCPSQLNVLPFIFYFPSFTSPAISFAFLILTVQLFCAAATYKSTRIRPIESSKRKRRGKSSARDERKRRRLMQKEKRRGKREAAEKRGKGTARKRGRKERETDRERETPPSRQLARGKQAWA